MLYFESTMQVVQAINSACVYIHTKEPSRIFLLHVQIVQYSSCNYTVRTFDVHEAVTRPDRAVRVVISVTGSGVWFPKRCWSVKVGARTCERLMND